MRKDNSSLVRRTMAQPRHTLRLGNLKSDVLFCLPAKSDIIVAIHAYH